MYIIDMIAPPEGVPLPENKKRVKRRFLKLLLASEKFLAHHAFPFA
ncbi:hypothetical protein LJC59_03755 [Desulfovibrio sp. OttesenSCG-928-A18]|nr:hypothetical protein [Desulfovibrio sp. OttesenSCG-928-A18]